MSLVVVVVGLVVGGIFAGRSMIKSSHMQAQVAQITAYEEAASAFRLKYGALPGDLKASRAASLDFLERAGGVGCGDGNGNIGGITTAGDMQTDCSTAGVPTPGGSKGNEWFYFWADLRQAELIDFAFDYSVMNVGSGKVTSDLSAGKILPFSKMGEGYGYIAVGGGAGSAPLNYYFIDFDNGNPSGTPQRSIPAEDAFLYDSKVDDGLPASGNVRSVAPADATDLNSGLSLPSTTLFARACYKPQSLEAFLGSLIISPAFADCGDLQITCANDFLDGSDCTVCNDCPADPGCFAGNSYNSNPAICACGACALEALSCGCDPGKWADGMGGCANCTVGLQCNCPASQQADGGGTCGICTAGMACG
ncbi:MAG: hypothetical protein EBR02_08735, partial [Alphaproteobacteria bacterium]|nr:hypothetical protein [Alphaproteobacteria bacterium]